ncbi:MAG: hypothetical protein LBT47_02585 [Deltaproteobacteria bacterium]|jgi:hypothetical protein|nr:hypothetical protein [Deltaproteobacteria bacterium]
MNVFLEELDSQAFGRNVLKINDPEEVADFENFEREHIMCRSPYYVYVKILAESLSLIHYFEEHGFRFVEYQLEMTKRLPTKKYDTAMFGNIFRLEDVGPMDDIEPILRLADEIFKSDRIFLDPEVDVSLARNRYRLYITKSWRSTKENLIMCSDLRDNSLIGFHTHLKQDSVSMLHFLGGVAPNHKGSGATIGFERMLFNRWIDEGIRKVTTHISLSNYKIMEAEYKAFDFKAKQSWAVLRKIYPTQQ